MKFNHATSVYYSGKKDKENIATQKPQLQNKSETSKVEQLQELKNLLESGVLTQEEFDTEKQKILNS